MGSTGLSRSDAGKLERLWDDHVAPLNRTVACWRQRPDLDGFTIPWFDPDDGGVGASVLLLLEAPSPATARSGDLSICSEDNHDATNRILKELRSASGLERREVVKWNIVPWASGIPASSTPLRVPAVSAALPALEAIMRLLTSTE